jgi:RNA polymerase sigma factor (sigma-70 family)
LTDDELIGRTKRGERQAFEELVRRYQEVAFRTAWIILRDDADAEDAAQTAFIKAWRAIDRFRDGAPFRPWLLQIVANEAKNRRVAVIRDRSRTVGLDAQPLRDPASPEADAIARERDDRLLTHVNALAEADRLVVACRYVLDLSEAETAAVLGCARGTVKSRLHRALGRLRERMAGER